MSLCVAVGVYYHHPRQATSHELSPQSGIFRQITQNIKNIKNLKFIDKIKQRVYIGVFKGAEFKNGI